MLRAATQVRKQTFMGDVAPEGGFRHLLLWLRAQQWCWVPES